MRSQEFIGQLDHDRIVAAIRTAESRTSGQIRIYIQRGNLKGGPVAPARKQFEQLGMHKTRAHNAVLIYVAPRSRKFAVIGDQGIHERCGDALWQTVVAKMTDHFKGERFTEAIVEAVQDLGEVLSVQFPATTEGQKNELPDDVIEG